MWQPRLIVLQPTPYCNISCSYCYLGHRDERRLMSPAVIEAVHEKLFSRLASDSEVSVVWHAGEPTAAPIDWYEHAYARLTDACSARIGFAMQSNGITIDERWIDLFRRTNTHVSLSIDGPQRFHDARRRTRNNKPTWDFATRGLQRLQNAGFQPNIITVLHPDGLGHPDEYYEFYRDHGVNQVSFSIDETEGAHACSSFAGRDYKPSMTGFLTALLRRAYREGFPLHIREIERIAQVLAGGSALENEQLEPWAAVVVAADGSISTFSPELMEVRAPEYGDFIFGNILTGDFGDFATTAAFQRAREDIARGVAACRSSCRYFPVCGGGAPVNKFCETGTLCATETDFCRLSIQAAADALMAFVSAGRERPPRTAIV
jgi:uncharacterized protein